jgi:3-oxoacyl-(acyl-carrier-protein) synthase
MSILGTTTYRDGAFRHGETRFGATSGDADARLSAAWATLAQDYPRFHRADRLSRLVLLSTAPFFAPGGPLAAVDPERIGMLLCTCTGSMECDARYNALLSADGVASPGLFVPTLPSIALGEFSIRHGLHGSGLCQLMPAPSAAALAPAIGMLRQQGMRWIVCGWADTFADRASAAFAAIDTEAWEIDDINRIQDLFDEH